MAWGQEAARDGETAALLAEVLGGPVAARTAATRAADVAETARLKAAWLARQR